MKLEVAEYIAWELGLGSIRDEYCGRHMHGKSTTGVVVDDISELTKAVANQINDDDDLDRLLDLGLIHDGENPNSDKSFEFEFEFYTYHLNFRTDNMGKRYIVY